MISNMFWSSGQEDIILAIARLNAIAIEYEDRSSIHLVSLVN